MWKRERRVIEMKGYYNQEDSGTGLEVPTGRLSIRSKEFTRISRLDKSGL